MASNVKSEASSQFPQNPNREPDLPKGLRFLGFSLVTSLMVLLVLFGVAELLFRVSGLGAPPPPLNPTIFQTDPYLGVILKPGWMGSFAGAKVSVNQSGMRGPEIPSMKEEPYRILLSGDSFAFGYGLEEEGTLRSHLEGVSKSILPASGTCVINGGVPGYNLIQDVSWTLQVGLSQSPDWIILVVVPNDLEPPNWLDSKTRPPLRDTQDWLMWIKGDPRVFELPGVKRFNLVNLTQRLLKVVLPSQRSLAQDYFRFCNDITFTTTAWPKTQAALMSLKNEVQTRGIRLTLVLYPVPVRLKDAPFSPFNEKISGFCQQASLEVLDPSHDWVDISESQLRWHPDDLHPSGFANQIMAEFLLSNLGSGAT